MGDELEQVLRGKMLHDVLCAIPISHPIAVEIDRLTTELAEARDRLQEERDTRHERFLEWRGIYTDDGGKPCKDCSGTGYKAYGSTSTWHGGAGGQAITSGVCDKCWGSGDINNPWTNLRNLYGLKSRAEQAEAELARYKQGVEVTGDYIDEPDNGHMWWLDLDDKLPFDNGQHVRVLVMKEVE